MMSSKTILCYNSNPNAVQGMLDYEWLTHKTKTLICGIINPNSKELFEKYYFGNKEILIPVFTDLIVASQKTNATILINFASSRSVLASTLEALKLGSFETITILAEGVPENHSRTLISLAKQTKTVIVGPASIGMIVPEEFKSGSIGGTIQNILDSKLHVLGSAGLVSRSGGMFNELATLIGKHGDGLAIGVSIGGDRFPCSTFIEHVMSFQKNPQVKYIVLLGEVGGVEEYEVLEAVKHGSITKPVIAYCIGSSAESQKQGVQFGHAGASANSEMETATAKNLAMKQAGIHVPDSMAGLSELIVQFSDKRKEQQDITKLLNDYSTMTAERKETHFVTTISDDRGEEASYAGHPISTLALPDSGFSFVDILTLLWFKKVYPKWASQFIETILKTVADHGPSVSGAIVSKITARAGKDAVSSLIAGLSTIGPRFGGAIDGSAKQFKNAFDRGLTPSQFVEEYKQKNELLLGIGHKVKSIHNLDKRVAQLYELITKTFPSHSHVDYALEVQTITTSKKPTLILNVDGMIANAMIDLWSALGYSSTEIDELIEMGVLNGFFIVARSVGLLGHIYDEKRLKSGLYRHPSDDILFKTESSAE
jgi:ATP-citrate lyase alpha-subunit